MLSAASGIVTVIDKHKIDFTVGPLTFAVSVANSALFGAKKDQTLLLHMYWNQETGPVLFGFLSSLERTLFTLILTCSGIGPKIALAVLDHLGAHAFIEAVQTGNSKLLSNVPGIGAKKAEQIIFNVKHKIEKLLETGVIMPPSTISSTWVTVTQALESLNYSRIEINRAMEHVQEQLAGNTASFDQLMRSALSALSKQK